MKAILFIIMLVLALGIVYAEEETITGGGHSVTELQLAQGSLEQQLLLHTFTLLILVLVVVFAIFTKTAIIGILAGLAVTILGITIAPISILIAIIMLVSGIAVTSFFLLMQS
jgi:hypothetical protein